MDCSFSDRQFSYLWVGNFFIRDRRLLDRSSVIAGLSTLDLISPSDVDYGPRNVGKMTNISRTFTIISRTFTNISRTRKGLRPPLQPIQPYLKKCCVLILNHFVLLGFKRKILMDKIIHGLSQTVCGMSFLISFLMCFRIFVLLMVVT